MVWMPFSFGNSNYKMRSVVTSITGELNSRFSNNVQNKLLATYTHISDTREQKWLSIFLLSIYIRTESNI